MKTGKLILNILMLILLYFFTLYFIIVFNLIFTMWSEFSKELTEPFFMIFVYGLFVIWIYLLYILFIGIRKKTLDKNYLYAYLAFYVLFFVFYFAYYIQYDKGDFIPEIDFYTKLQNIEVSDEENGLKQLGKLFTENEEFNPIISNLNSKISNNYRCLTLGEGKKCEEINLEKSLELYSSGSNEIDKVNNIFYDIIDYQYFKQETDEDYVNLSNLSAISRISLFSAIEKIKKGEENEAIKILLTYKKLGDKLLEGDSSLVGIIVGVMINNIIIENINYILDNYKISDKNLDLLKNELSKTYDSKDIIFNVVKMEYWSNKYGFIEGNVNSSMLLNKNDFYNENRNARFNLINGNEAYQYKDNYFKINYIYKFLGGVSNFSLFTFSGYKENIDDLNLGFDMIIKKIDEL